MHDPQIYTRRASPREIFPTSAYSTSTAEHPVQTQNIFTEDPPPRRERDSNHHRRNRREQQQTDFFEVSLRESAPIYSSTKWTVHQHRVHIIRCAHCNAFLSDRGMRVCDLSFII